MDSSTACRMVLITSLGAALPVMAVPETIMLAPAWNVHKRVNKHEWYNHTRSPSVHKIWANDTQINQMAPKEKLGAIFLFWLMFTKLFHKSKFWNDLFSKIYSKPYSHIIATFSIFSKPHLGPDWVSQYKDAVLLLQESPCLRKYGLATLLSLI